MRTTTGCALQHGMVMWHFGIPLWTTVSTEAQKEKKSTAQRKTRNQETIEKQKPRTQALRQKQKHGHRNTSTEEETTHTHTHTHTHTQAQTQTQKPTHKHRSRHTKPPIIESAWKHKTNLQTADYKTKQTVQARRHRFLNNSASKQIIVCWICLFAFSNREADIDQKWFIARNQ